MMMNGLPRMDPRTALFDAELAAPHGEKGYGAPQPQSMQKPRAKSLQARRKLNGCGLFQVLVVPILLFVGSSYVMSFRMYYDSPAVSLLLVGAGLLLVLVIGGVALQLQKRELAGGERTWYFILFCSSAFAVIAGALLGFICFSAFSHNYYKYISLRKIVDADPGQLQGGQALDAGEIVFRAGAQVNRNLNSIWHKGTLYCVAPMVSSDFAKLGSYDFWAVGTDCCSSRQGDFGCGTSAAWMPVPGQHVSGLRVLDGAEIRGYQLAVEQATAAYNIQAKKPIFMKMYRDTKSFLVIKAYMNNANMFFIVSCIIYAIIHCGIVGRITYSDAVKARHEGWAGSGI